MTQLTQCTLLKMYKAIYNHFRKGEYTRFATVKEQGDAELKPKPALSEGKSHAATLDFMLFLFCSHQSQSLNYYQKFYKGNSKTGLLIPFQASKIQFDRIAFQDFIEFISPETKKTSGK